DGEGRGQGGIDRELGLAAQLVAGPGVHVAKRLDRLANGVPGVLEEAADYPLDRVKAELEPRGDAEVGTPAAKSPKQLGVRVPARANHVAAGGHQLGADQVVAGEPVLGGQVADAAAEREAGDPGGAD